MSYRESQYSILFLNRWRLLLRSLGRCLRMKASFLRWFICKNAFLLMSQSQFGKLSLVKSKPLVRMEKCVEDNLCPRVSCPVAVGTREREGLWEFMIPGYTHPFRKMWVDGDGRSHRICCQGQRGRTVPASLCLALCCSLYSSGLKRRDSRRPWLAGSNLTHRQARPM